MSYSKWEYSGLLQSLVERMIFRLTGYFVHPISQNLILHSIDSWNDQDWDMKSQVGAFRIIENDFITFRFTTVAAKCAFVHFN